MRSDSHTINGLTAYILGTAQSDSALSVANDGASVSLSDTKRPTSDVSKGFPYSYPAETPIDTHYTDVDEVVADDDVSFVYTGESALYVYDRYGKPSYTLPTGAKIAMVRVVARVKTTYATRTTRQADVAFGVEIGGTYYLSPNYRTNDVWQTIAYDFVRNPATNLEWTTDDVNGANFAVRGRGYLYADTYETANITQIYLEIYIYTDATVYYSIDVIQRSSAGLETTLASKICEVNSLISALYDSPGLKSGSFLMTLHSLVSTDSIVIKLYQRVGAGAWNLVRTWTTEQLGAQSLDAATWTTYYYLNISATTTMVSTVYWHGTATYDSRIENFTWTPVPVAPQMIGEGLSWVVG